MKVLITGANGQLGHDLMNRLHDSGLDCLGCDITDKYAGIADGSPVTRMPYSPMDITRREDVFRVAEDFGPDAVIHCAAWTQVDAAEDNEDKCRLVNAGGARNIAEACRRTGAAMVYISTDYVFDGKGTKPWEPDQPDFAPINVYGQTKLEGELAVKELLDRYYIVRISWVFGISGNNFVKTMLRVGKNRPEVRVVNDQIGTPTYTKDLAALLEDMIQKEQYGIYHASNEGGYISWYDFTKEIYRQAGYDTRVVPVTTAEYGLSKAPRPSNSRLDRSKLPENGFAPLPDW